jgi:hypothetical protein
MGRSPGSSIEQALGVTVGGAVELSVMVEVVDAAASQNDTLFSLRFLYRFDVRWKLRCKALSFSG